MAPNTPDRGHSTEAEPGLPRMPKWARNEEIVISGLSGRFSGADNMKEFRDNLMNRVEAYTEDDSRWPPGLLGLPRKAGKIRDIAKFDATYFGIHGIQTENMDPQLRQMLELTHEAISDAGVNDADLRGKNIGVFVGSCSNDYLEALDRLPLCGNAFSMTGNNRGMLANRVSFHFDFQGPSICIDTACASSLYALDLALLSLRNNRCDAAIVGGVQTHTRPAPALGFHKLGMLSKDGKSSVFDEDANGYVRSEGSVVLFLQSSKEAKRIYATVVHSKTVNEGYKEQGITFPRAEIQRLLMSETYAEAGINPKDVAYVEAHGTGTPIGDPEELNAIAEIFCKGRNSPLLVGSVKSGYGHSEASSGLVAIAKVIIGMEESVIPAHINFKKPNPKIPCLFDGRVKVVTENTPWHGGLVGINSFGFGGADAHVILRSHPYPKIHRPYGYNDGLKLFLQAGRTEDSLNSILDAMEADPADQDFYTLASGLSNSPVKTYPFRGYTILNSTPPKREVKRLTATKRPIWYVMTGMGCQWRGMARDMMQIPVFRDSILRANDILKPHNMNLLNLLMSESDETWAPIIHSFVALISIQVALVNTLRAIGVEPDGIVGHSVGEVSCAYADGCFTEEQAVLAAFWRGRLSVDEPGLPVGLMASIGLSWEEAEKRLPSNIYLACNNSEDNVTISGHREDVLKFLEELKKDGVFYRAVNTGNLSYHCKNIHPVAPKLLAAVKKLVPNPKPRTSRWISSSVPEAEWNSPLATTSSADYHVNNLKNPVLFLNAMKKVPKDAIMIEIGAHSLLQAIVKRNMGTDITYIGVQKRGENGLHHFLQAMGSLYLNGRDVAIQNLWETSQLPVSRGTRMISPYVGWDHSEKYELIPFQVYLGLGGAEKVFDVSIDDESNERYLVDHAVDGRVLYPATGYLTLAWKVLAQIKNQPFTQLPVVFEDVTFQRPVILNKSTVTKLSVGIIDATGQFEISEDGAVAVTGRIYEPEDRELKYAKIVRPATGSKDYLPITTKDIYKELRLRGYTYGPEFQLIIEADSEGNTGKMRWNGNWVSYIDGMLQFSVLNENTRGLFLPSRVDYLKINPLLHPEATEESIEVPIVCDHVIGMVASGGVEARIINKSPVNRRPETQAEPILERHLFIPFNEQRLSDVRSSDVIKTCVDIVEESVIAPKIKAVEILAADGNLFPQIVSAINYQLLVTADCIVTDGNTDRLNSGEASKYGARVVKWDYPNQPIPDSISGAHLVFGHNILSGDENVESRVQILANVVRDDGFILISQSAENKAFHKAFKSAGLEIISEKTDVNQAVLFLLRKVKPIKDNFSVVVITEDQYDKWLEPLKQEMQILATDESSQRSLWLVAHDSSNLGILGMANCLRQEPGGDRVRIIFNPNLDASKSKLFHSDPVSALKTVYPELLRKNLFATVNKNGVWGSYRHLPLNFDVKNDTVETTDAYVNVLTRGDLASLRWIQSPMRKLIGDSTPHIAQIYYASLNFKDIMLASGKIAPEAVPEDWANKDCLGMEFSGRNEKGQRIMGAVLYRGLATSTSYDPTMSWIIPDNWTLEEAATVPLVYYTVYYALFVRGKLRKGESLLIHSGTGGIGQAAIAVALSYNCEIYTTVGTPEKKEALLKIFPKLKPENVFNSRDTTFENNVMLATNGKGVDIVLNSLSDEKLIASVRCLAKFGRFLEIGKYDLSKNSPLGMGVFLKNASFHGVFADTLYHKDHPERQRVSDLLAEGIKSGVVKPLTRHVYNADEVEAAFRFMASGKHIGKVLIKIAEEEPEKVVPNPKKVSIPAVLKTAFYSHKSYIITGGLGGFGMEVAHWLIDRGAKNIILSSRSGVRDGYQSRCVRIWRTLGVNVTISTHDITTLDGATKLVNDAIKLGPVGGIFNLAMVLKDAFIENQTVETYVTVASPKVLGTRFLDSVSRKLCPQLDLFVCFSSLASGKGNAGQTNYAYSNSVMERICEQRHQDGLHGLAIQWGGIGDVGVVAEIMGGNDLVVGNTIPQRIRSCNAALDVFLNQKHPVVSSYCRAPKEQAVGDGGKKASLLDSISRILGVKNIRVMDENLTLAELGMDSIMGVEIKQTLERHFDLALSMTSIRKLDIKNIKEIESGDHTAEEGAVAATAAKSDDEESEEELIDENLVTERYDFDEIIHTESIVRLNCITEGQPIFIVHPIEGHISSLKALGSQLRCPAFGIQFTGDSPLTTMEEIAAYYIKKIKEKQPNGPYRLSGYSFGASMSCEMASQLQAAGDVIDSIVFLDGSQKFITNYVDDEYWHKLKNNELNGQDEIDAIMLFTSNFSNVVKFNPENLKREIQSLPTWEKRTQAAVKVLMQSGLFKSERDAEYTTKCWCHLGKICLLYELNYKINTNAILIKGTNPGLIQKYGDDYGLSMVIDGKVDVHVVPGNHHTFLHRENASNAANIINQAFGL